MITLLLWFTPLALSAQTETITLTSGLTIEARYLPDEDAFLVGLEDFGSLTADLELAGPSCTLRVDALKASCRVSLEDAVARADARCAEVERAWLLAQDQQMKLEAKLIDTKASLSLWQWVSAGTSVLAFGAMTYLALTR